MSASRSLSAARQIGDRSPDGGGRRSAAPGGSERHRLVRVLDHEPDLAAALPADQRLLAHRIAVAETEHLHRGPWEVTTPPSECLCGLVLRGLVVREVTAAETTSAELLGPGDVFVLGPESQGEFVPASVEWFVIDPAQVAWLGPQFEQAIQRFPELNRALFQRLGETATRAGFAQNLAQLTRVDDRVLVLLWHLAERFGRVTAGGVVLPLRLTHRMIARLVGAQRPTVTTAFSKLEGGGTIERHDDGAIVLHGPVGAPLARVPSRAESPWTGPAARRMALGELRRQRDARGDPPGSTTDVASMAS